MNFNFEQKRPVELVVVSDVHLGTYGCHAVELARYLDSINPKTLILNGDIIEMWQFNKRYWPAAHMKVLEILLHMLATGTKVYYLTGNHDDTLRRFSPFAMGQLLIKDKLVLEIDGKKAWFFHGDVLDSVVLKAKWLAKLGAVGYDALILINRLVNYVLLRVGKPRLSLSKKVKSGVKRAMAHVSKFENTIAELAQKNGFDWVICGHIHEPQIKYIGDLRNGPKVMYLNSGDWVENLTALEYSNQTWRIHRAEDTGDSRAQIMALNRSVPPHPITNEASDYLDVTTLTPEAFGALHSKR